LGNLSLKQASVYAGLPPAAQARIEKDADRQYEARVSVFGPPPAPTRMPWADHPIGRYGPTEKGPLIQFIDDRLARAPLTPQTRLGWEAEVDPAP